MTYVLYTLAGIVLFFLIPTGLFLLFNKKARNQFFQDIRKPGDDIKLHAELQMLYLKAQEDEFTEWFNTRWEQQGHVTKQEVEQWVKRTRNADKANLRSDFNFRKWLRNRVDPKQEISPERAAQLYAEWKSSN